LSNPASVPLSQIVGRVSERNRENIDRVLTVSAQHGLVKQESFFTKRVAAKNLSSYLVVRQGTFVYNKSYSAAAPFGVATYNKTAEPGVISPLYFTFRPNPELVLDEYLEYVLNSNTFHQQMARYIKEGGRAHGGINVSVDDYLSVQVLLPTLQEQRRVVDLIAAVDSYIAALQQQADSARSARSAVLSELLTAGGDDWTRTTLGAHIKIVMGQAPPGKDCNKDGIGVPFVKAGEFTDGFPLIREWTTNPLRFSKLGDTLICVVGATCGKLSKGIDCAIGRSVAALQPLETLDSGFLWNFMSRKVQEMRDSSRGSAQGVITKDDLADLPLVLPPFVEQKRIVESVSSMNDVIQSSEKAVTDAKSLRSGLLSDLLSGAHEIPESYDRLLGAA